MSSIKHVINALNGINKKGKLLSKEDVILILEATKEVSIHKKIINSLIFLFTTINKNSHLKKLTNREQQILYLIGNGLKTSEIAIQLKRSSSTIETHRKNIRKKLNLVGKGKLIEYAILNNLQQNKL
ncbi:transcriptional regulator [Ichthyenterobacterium magnum]|uniref:Regulatory LuxR family protein n=1 Tax=Ichthyenterobacterium magnum TaxID=1230530 RepID=A0A420DEI9_9FLAO|nr:LuxR C-terminal-related transcriptional regulator [Ichthyenterobacterium magnum]RKE90828.1 regulatory LuxR family protein [Ichthyenterobacterium magnum]